MTESTMAVTAAEDAARKSPQVDWVSGQLELQTSTPWA